MPSGYGWMWVGTQTASDLPEWPSSFDENARAFHADVDLDDPVFWWQTGPAAGVYAIGRIAGPSTPRKTTGKLRGQYLVPVEVSEKRLKTPLLAVEMLHVPALRDLVKRCRIQGKNFRRILPAQLQALRTLLPRATVRKQTGGNGTTGQGFASAARNRAVEQAAIAHVTNHYTRQGWSVTSKEDEDLGFDLECRKGPERLHVEVKGTSGGSPAFLITKGELTFASKSHTFHLAIVTSALHNPRLVLLSYPQLMDGYNFSPVTYRATPR